MPHAVTRTRTPPSAAGDGTSTVATSPVPLTRTARIHIPLRVAGPGETSPGASLAHGDAATAIEVGGHVRWRGRAATATLAP